MAIFSIGISYLDGHAIQLSIANCLSISETVVVALARPETAARPPLNRDAKAEAIVGENGSNGGRSIVVAIGPHVSLPIELLRPEGMHGLRTSTNANPGQRMPSTIMAAKPCGSIENPRAIKLALAAMASESGLNGRSPMLRRRTKVLNCWQSSLDA